MLKQSLTPALIVGCLAFAGACERTESEAPRSGGSEDARVEHAANTSTPTTSPILSVPHVGSCEPAPELVSIVSRIADTADASGNGQIEREEAYAASDFLVGGFFFYADKNGDGTVTPEEGRAARQQLMDRYPGLTATLTAGGTPKPGFSKLSELLGVSYAQGVSSTEMRAAAHRVADEVFEIADSNRDNSLTLAEAQAAGHERMRTVAAAAFKSSDRDGDRHLTLAEFRAVLDQPLQVAFHAADVDKDGKLSEAESAGAVRGAVRRLWVPGAPSSNPPLSTN